MTREDDEVTWDELRVQWNELSEHARRNWTRLTARDLRVIAGNRERLVGILQLHYGAHRRTIEREVRAFTRSFCAAPGSAVSDSNHRQLPRPT
jgi:uncharacterized protein YjbJ (UPF0337 family)